MRILLANDTYPPDINGNSIFTKRLAVGLAGRGHEVHVLVPSRSGKRLTQTVSGITHHYVPSIRLPGYGQFRVSVPPMCHIGTRNILGAVKPDVVHVHSHLLIGRSVIDVARKMGIPLVATSHFMPRNLTVHLRLPSPFIDLIERLAWIDLVRNLNMANVVVGPSKWAIAQLASLGVNRPLVSVSCGVDVNLYSRSTVPVDAIPKQRDAVPTFLFVGRVEREKNIQHLLQALQIVLESIRARLVIVGQGRDMRRLAKIAKRLGVSNQVTFFGNLDESQLIAIYRTCDVFCIASTTELQSLVVLEAMAAGKPVIAVECGPLPELVKDGVNGRTYPINDIDALAAQLVSLLSHKAMRSTFGREGRRIARLHSVNETVAAHEKLYISLARSSATSAK